MSTEPFDADEYVEALRRDPQGVNAADWHVDWSDGAWPVKVYSGARRIALDRDSALGRLLRYTGGVTAVRFDPSGGLPPTPGNPAPAHAGQRYVARRPVPSGGAMYPTEIYLVDVRGEQVLHYDPYRHELSDLAARTPSEGIRFALGLSPERSLPRWVVVLTHRFWKNFYKYGDFASRLGAVDVGVVLGRAVRLATAEFGTVDLRLDFADAALADWLGVECGEEAPYAVLGLGAAEVPDVPARRVAAEPPATLEKSRHVKRSARFDAMQAAARLAALPEPPARPLKRERVVERPQGGAIDLLDRDAMVRRSSQGRWFTGGIVRRDVVVSTLAHTWNSVEDVRFSANGVLVDGVDLYCAAHRIDGVPAGWYRYRPEDGHLVQVGEGEAPDCARVVQRALFAGSINVELAAFTVHVATALDFRAAGRNERGYREQQMMIGTAVEVITLAAQGVGLSGHAVLGYDVDRIDQRYGLLGSGRGTHAQVSVGAVAPSGHWEIEVTP